MSERNRPRFARSHIIAIVVAFLAIAVTTSTAQVGIFPTPTPRYTPPPPTPSPTAPPSAAPTLAPEPTETDIPLPSDDPADTPKPKASPSSSPAIVDEKLDALPPELEEKPTLVVPVIPRTRPRNTAKLVDLLEPLVEFGLPLEQVLVEGMGRFPVAGVAYYRDDWLHPRYSPTPHLHHGLDIFAEWGTPVRAPDKGVVTRLTNTPDRGGLGVWTRGRDGTAYYYAHLLERAEGIYVGMPVEVGTVVGYVGDSGNARGGTPHLHFEIHRGGPIPPKPSVDKWLDEAIDLAPRWAQARRSEIESKRNVLGGSPGMNPKRTRSDLEASMLLTLLDPVGGSVGLLPRLELAPARRQRVSSGLLIELIRLRLDGYLFVPSSNALHLRD